MHCKLLVDNGRTHICKKKLKEKLKICKICKPLTAAKWVKKSLYQKMHSCKCCLELSEESKSAKKFAKNEMKICNIFGTLTAKK